MQAKSMVIVNNPAPGVVIKEKGILKVSQQRTGAAPPEKENNMEIVKMNENTMQEWQDRGCFLEPFTINGEKYLYIIHPAESKRNRT